MKRTFLSLRLFSVALLLFPSGATAELSKAKAFAPDNHVELKDTISGSYFIAKPLKEEYDRLLSRLTVVRADIEAERTSGTAALRELKSLQTDLEKLRKEIEEKKLFVPVAKMHVVSETITFDLGKEKLLVITGDNVQLVGWEGPGVKCVLEKTVLTADGKLDEAELAALKLIHKHGVAKEQVGRTQAETDADEAAFLKSKDSQGLSPQSREFRRKLVSDIQSHYAVYGDFQGKEIDTLEIEGLTGQQGNRQMTLEVSSKEGGGTFRSVWRRHARLTVYIPECKAVAIRGGLESLEIEKVKTSLVLTADDSHNRDYHNESRVRGVTGSVTARNIPLQTLEDVSGDVSLTCTVELANSGTTHDGGSEPGQLLRTHHFYRPLPCSVKNVGGSFQAWLNRVDLQLENVAGKLDVRNEFGDTKLTLTRPLAKQPHRVVSEAGRIELNLAPTSLGELPLWAITQCGNVRTNASRELLDTFSTTLGHDAEGVSRSWSGFRRSKKEDGKFDAEYFDSLSRPEQALRGQDRPAGLDLLSRGGTVVVNVTP